MLNVNANLLFWKTNMNTHCAELYRQNETQRERWRVRAKRRKVFIQCMWWAWLLRRHEKECGMTKAKKKREHEPHEFSNHWQVRFSRSLRSCWSREMNGKCCFLVLFFLFSMKRARITDYSNLYIFSGYFHRVLSSISSIFLCITFEFFRWTSVENWAISTTMSALNWAKTDDGERRNSENEWNFAKRINDYFFFLLSSTAMKCV